MDFAASLTTSSWNYYFKSFGSNKHYGRIGKYTRIISLSFTISIDFVYFLKNLKAFCVFSFNFYRSIYSSFFFFSSSLLFKLYILSVTFYKKSIKRLNNALNKFPNTPTLPLSLPSYFYSNS